MGSETDYKRWLRGGGELHCSGIEYGRGGSAGFPDLVFHHSSWRESLFVEAKVGGVSGGLLWFTEIRRDQFAWLREFSEYNGPCFVFVGVRERVGWSTYVLPYPSSAEFKLAFQKEEIDVGRSLKISDRLRPTHHSLLLEWKGRFNCEKN